MDKNITLFPGIMQNGFVDSNVLQLKTTFFISLVESACHQLLRHFNPMRPGYILPSSYCGESFISLAESDADALNVNNAVWHNISGQRLYVNLWNQIELILQYVQFINLNPDKYHIGEESHTRRLIYKALFLAHNWKVRCIEDTHRKDGKNFGSATGWQTENFFKNVEDWPDRYTQIQKEKALVLPCERPDYFKD